MCIEVLEFCVHCAYFSLERFSSSLSLSPFLKEMDSHIRTKQEEDFLDVCPILKDECGVIIMSTSSLFSGKEINLKAKEFVSSSLASSLFYNYVSPFIL